MAARFPLHSTTKRFLQTVGFAFSWAAFFGAVIGGIVYFRPPRTLPDEELPWYLRLRLMAERVELWTYDWRARQLGERSTRSDAVVPVVIDDDALASAQADPSQVLGGVPWPRETVGSIVGELVDEGASLVVLAQPLSDPSPRSCDRRSGQTDDDGLHAKLAQVPRRSVLTYAWSTNLSRQGERELNPYLFLVDRVPGFEQARERIRQLLSARAPAYLIPDGGQLQLWAGVPSEQRAKELAEVWGLKGALTVRQRTARESAYEVPAWRLLVSLAAVDVVGLDPKKLPHARSLNPPVAPLLSDVSLFGGSALLPDADGVVRAFPHFVRYSADDGREYVLPSAPVVAAMQLAGTAELAWQGGRLFVGDKFSLPMDEAGFSILRWDAPEVGRGAKGSLRRSVSAWRPVANLMVRANQGSAVRHSNDLQDRVALFTQATGGETRTVPTPIGLTPDAALVGQSLVNILRSEGISRVEPRLDLFATLAFAFVGAVLAVAFSALVRVRGGGALYWLGLAVAGVAYVYVARELFIGQQRWISIVGPLCAMTATFTASLGYVATFQRRLREFLMSSLGRAPSHITRMVESDLALLRPERRSITVFFSDTEGFTALSDRLEPEKVVALLHEYLSEMSEVVHSTGGQIDKYIGDAVMAFWGAPVPIERHAGAACDAVLRMREVLDKRRPDWERRFGHRLEFRAGINTGSIVVGDLGSEHRASYTVTGTAVALAARLEGMNRVYGTFVLVGEATVQGASDHLFREIDQVRSPGQASLSRVYELVGRKGSVPVSREKELALFARALEAYRRRRFEDALPLFRQAATEHKDPVATLYERRCRWYVNRPPPIAWDGVFDGDLKSLGD